VNLVATFGLAAKLSFNKSKLVNLKVIYVFMLLNVLIGFKFLYKKFLNIFSCTLKILHDAIVLALRLTF